MTALKGADIDAYVARPDGRAIALVYGADAGLVGERVAALLRASVSDVADPFAVVRLAGETLAAEPGRLMDEVRTIPLFGGRRAVWLRAGSGNIVEAVETLLAEPPKADCRVIIEAGELKPASPLRNLIEQAKAAVALPCYVDDERALARLVAEELRQAKLTISPNAQTLLVSLIGGDRQASRNEIRKLALFAHGKGRVEEDDVLAVVADAATLALDAVVDVCFAGQPAAFDAQFARARIAGLSGAAILSAAVRQAALLHRARVAIESGASAVEAIRAAFPRLFFRRESLVKAALATWTAARLARAMVELADAALAARKLPSRIDAAAEAAIHRALLAVAAQARRAA